MPVTQQDEKVYIVKLDNHELEEAFQSRKQVEEDVAGHKISILINSARWTPASDSSPIAPVTYGWTTYLPNAAGAMGNQGSELELIFRVSDGGELEVLK